MATYNGHDETTNERDLCCIGSQGDQWFDKVPVGTGLEFDLRIRIEKPTAEQWGIGVMSRSEGPLSPPEFVRNSTIFVNSVTKAIENAIQCADMYGRLTPTVLRNSDPNYNTLRAKYMNFPNQRVFPLIDGEVSDDGEFMLSDTPVVGEDRYFSVVMALIQSLSAIDLALFLYLELTHNREMLNAIPPGMKAMDPRYYGIGNHLVQSGCMAVETILKTAILCVDRSYSPMKHNKHTSDVWQYIVSEHPTLADSIVECYNRLPSPWDECLEIIPAGEPARTHATVSDIGSIMSLLDVDGGIYSRSRYPHEIDRTAPKDADGYHYSFTHHDTVLPTIKVAVAVLTLVADQVSIWREQSNGI